MALLLHVYVFVADLIDKIVTHPFASTLLATRFSDPEAVRLARGLSAEHPLASSLVRLLSLPRFQGISDTDYISSLARADPFALVPQVLRSRDFAAAVLGSIFSNRTETIPNCTDLLVAALATSQDSAPFDDAELVERCLRRIETAGPQVFRAGPTELRLAYTLFLSRIERLDWTIFGQALGQRLARRWVRFGDRAASAAQKPVPSALAARVLCSRFCISGLLGGEGKALVPGLSSALLDRCYRKMRQNALCTGTWELRGLVACVGLSRGIRLQDCPRWADATQLYTLKRAAGRLTGGDVLFYAFLTRPEALESDGGPWAPWGQPGQVTFEDLTAYLCD